MSKINIKYMDNSMNTRDITASTIEIKQNTMKIVVAEHNIHYIPLCNIKEFSIDGYNKIKGE